MDKSETHYVSKIFIVNSTITDFCTVELKTVNEDTTSMSCVIENQSTERYDMRTEFSESGDPETIVFSF